MLEIVPATRELVERYTGEAPAPTLRGFVALLDGEPVGVGGFAYRGEQIELFSDVKPAMKRYPVTLLRTARAVLELARRTGLPAYATRNESEPTAEVFLRRLGFELEGEVYRWHGLQQQRPI